MFNLLIFVFIILENVICLIIFYITLIFGCLELQNFSTFFDFIQINQIIDVGILPIWQEGNTSQKDEAVH